MIIYVRNRTGSVTDHAPNFPVYHIIKIENLPIELLITSKLVITEVEDLTVVLSSRTFSPLYLLIIPLRCLIISQIVPGIGPVYVFVSIMQC